MRKRWSTIVIVMIFLLGCCILLYPIVSDIWNYNHQSYAASIYKEATSQVDEKDSNAIWETAQAYNKSLLINGSRFCPTDEEDTYYQSLLRIPGTDVMAVLEIPAIHVYLPVYHGTDDDALQSGIGHLEGSSLPIGGSGTHTVLSGHRGLPSAKLLSDLNLMEIGDIFMIHVLGQVLVYETDQIEVVLPSEMNSLAITEGEDYVTLLTCTPYGINTHRLLVRGHYLKALTEEEIKQNENEVTSISHQWKPNRNEILALIPVPFLILALVIVLNPFEKIKERSNQNNHGNQSNDRKGGPLC